MCPCLRRIFQKLVGSTGMFLFFSYLNEKELTLPLRPGPGNETSCFGSSCCTSCLCPCDEDDDATRG